MEHHDVEKLKVYWSKLSIEELSQILIDHDEAQYSPEVFEAIRQVISERGETPLSKEKLDQTKAERIYAIQSLEQKSGEVNFVTNVADESFDCLIPDVPLSGYEQLMVGITTGGAFRTPFRPAIVAFKDEKISLIAHTDIITGGGIVKIREMNHGDISYIYQILIQKKKLFKIALTRSLLVGGMFWLTISVMIIIRIAISGMKIKINLLDSIILVIGLFVFSILLFGILFTFIPSLFQVKKNLSYFQFNGKDGPMILIALNHDQIEKAKIVLSKRNLVVKNYDNLSN